jgi:hypothetical protein
MYIRDGITVVSLLAVILASLVVSGITPSPVQAETGQGTDIFKVPLNASEGGGHLIEYVATFPNLTINPGEGYKACISTVKALELECKTGNNSPASRPEFVDLTLDAGGSDDDVEQPVAANEEDSGNGEGEDNVNATDDENGLSPGMPRMATMG